MLIKNLKLKNIRSYSEYEIYFKEGSTLLSGDIGSGKTSILMAIEFALFGLQPGQRGSSLLRNGENEGKVIIEFEVENKNIIIERTLKKSKTITQDYCAITIDGEKKEIAVTELKSRVLELLNYPREFAKKQNILYKFTVYTPQEEMKQIILQDVETRINTLRHVFGIDKYKKILENVAIVGSKIREEKRLNEAFTLNLEQDKLDILNKENNLKKDKENLKDIEKTLMIKKDVRKIIEREKEEISKKIDEKIKLQQEIEKSKLMLISKSDSIIQNNKTINELKKSIEEYQSLQFDEKKIIDFEKEINLEKKEREKLNHENIFIISQINSLKIKNEDNEKLEKKISSLEVCPTCLQDVDAVYRANVLNKARNDISQNKQKIEEFEFKKKEIGEKLKFVESNIIKKEKELTELKILKMKLEGIGEKQKRLDDLENMNFSLYKDIELLKSHNETLSKSILELRKYDGIFEEKKNELNEALKNERIADIKFAELKREIEVFSRQIQELKDKVKKIESVKEKLNYLAKLEDWLNKEFIPLISYIEKNVMIKLKTEFSRLFTEWFSMLVSDNFNVWLDDNFTPIIEQQDYEIDYAYLSGGERTAIALAYRLALNQIINSLISKIKTKDLVILDEPTDGFSDGQLDKMRDVLQQLNVKQLIIVSHEQKIEGFVENVVRLKKVDGVSGV